MLRTYLEDKINKSIVDPQHFKSEIEELRAYRIAYLMKKIAGEILEWVDTKVENAKYLRKKERGEIVQKDFKI